MAAVSFCQSRDTNGCLSRILLDDSSIGSQWTVLHWLRGLRMTIMLHFPNFCIKLFLLTIAKGWSHNQSSLYPEDEVQRNEAAWANIRFESKTQNTRIYKVWATKVLSAQSTTDILLKPSIRKPVDVSLDISVIRSHANLEFLVSPWSTEMHTFVTFWRGLYADSGGRLSDVALTGSCRRGHDGPHSARRGEGEGSTTECCP